MGCLPVTIDVGTNNEELLKDEFYIGLRQKRATGQWLREYAELIHEFMAAVKQMYGEKVLVQFEDFANHNAFDLLAKYGSTHLVFNDDIQGTASVVLAGLLAAQRMTGQALADHRYLFLGAGEAGTGIAELIAVEISKQVRAVLLREKCEGHLLELYNEEITDLLAPEELLKVVVEDKQKKQLPLMEDGKGGVLVRELKEEIVANASEIVTLLERESAKCRISETLLNKHSS